MKLKKSSIYILFLIQLTFLMSYIELTSAKTKKVEKLKHGISVHGVLKHPPHFKHYDFVNPDAPKGGRIIFLHPTIFNSLNPFSIQGSAAPEIRFWVFESLLNRSYDEPFAMYGQIAENIEYPDSGLSITFHLNKKAHFSDNVPITSNDVYFTFHTLKDKGLVFQRRSYSKVKDVIIHNKHKIEFIFHDNKDKELPLIIGLMPILPQHVYAQRDITKSSMEIPVGSGPYVVGKFNGSQFIEYKRNTNYWGAHLNVMKGRFNFDTIRFNIITDNTVSIEAIIAGQYDMRFIRSISEWHSRYNVSALDEGKIVKRKFMSGLPAGMRALVMNTRKENLNDIRVRKALNLAFDFETLNRKLFYNGYQRTQGFYDNSYLSSTRIPANEKEKKILKPFLKNVEPEILDGTYILPQVNTSSDARKNLKKAMELLKQAGYIIRNNALIDTKTNKPFVLNLILLDRYTEQKRVALHFQKNLRKIGITLNIEILDSSLYQNRLNTYDFDMMYYYWYASISPGNEQSFYWGSKGSQQEGTRNYMGANNKAVDAMIDALLQSDTQQDFIASARALDRVLRSQFYVIPLYHLEKQLLILSAHIATPKQSSLYGMRPESWWDKNISP